MQNLELLIIIVNNISTCFSITSQVAVENNVPTILPGSFISGNAFECDMFLFFVDILIYSVLMFTFAQVSKLYMLMIFSFSSN